MWSGALHNPEFVAKVVEHVDRNTKNYGTSSRMKGMLTVAQEVRVGVHVAIDCSDCDRRNSTSRFISHPAKLRVRSTAQRLRWVTLRTCGVYCPYYD